MLSSPKAVASVRSFLARPQVSSLLETSGAPNNVFVEQKAGARVLPVRRLLLSKKTFISVRVPSSVGMCPVQSSANSGTLQR